MCNQKNLSEKENKKKKLATAFGLCCLDYLPFFVKKKTADILMSMFEERINALVFI